MRENGSYDGSKADGTEPSIGGNKNIKKITGFSKVT